MKIRLVSYVRIRSFLLVCVIATCGLLFWFRPTTMMGQSTVVINEFLVIPMASPGQWVELYNTGNSAVDIDGWHFADSALDTYTISAANTGGTTIIPPSGLLVVRLDIAIFSMGSFDTVRLFDATDTLIDSQYYADAVIDRSFARMPDGGATWQQNVIPTPGESNGSPVPTLTNTPTKLPTATFAPDHPGILVINELLAAPVHGVEWVELYNPTDKTVNTTHWVIRRTSQTGDRREFTLGNQNIPPGGFLLQELIDVGFLPNVGAKVSLWYPDSTPVSYPDAFANYPALGPDQVYARTSDGASTWALNYPPSPGQPNLPPPTATPTNTPTTTPSATASNTPTASPSHTPEPSATVTATPEMPHTLVINELMANPADGQEWIELYNLGDQPITMDDWFLQRVSTGGTVRQQTLPTITIPPGGFLLHSAGQAFLPNDGAVLQLFDAVFRPVGSVVSYPALSTDQVYARVADGMEQWSIDFPPSPGQPNQPAPTATATATVLPTITVRPTQRPAPTATEQQPTPHDPDPTATSTTEPDVIDVLLLNELMAAPDDDVYESEWVELYYGGDQPIQLEDYSIRRISTGGGVRTYSLIFETETIEPQSFVIVSLLGSFLPNDGATVELLDKDGNRVGPAITYPALIRVRCMPIPVMQQATWSTDYLP
ncbi:MAG: hypothetical protein HC837_10465, partial [Chloroflexaceae bacterium]|nr:hypothetical protein [Chloroflexaceae bacterium]